MLSYHVVVALAESLAEDAITLLRQGMTVVCCYRMEDYDPGRRDSAKPVEKGREDTREKSP